jgi:hypothetical protein
MNIFYFYYMRKKNIFFFPVKMAKYGGKQIWFSDWFDGKNTDAENVSSCVEGLRTVRNCKEYLASMARSPRSTGKKTFINIDYHTSGKCEFVQFLEMLKDCLFKVAAADKRSAKAMYCAQIASAVANMAVLRARELRTLQELEEDRILTFLKFLHAACFSTLMVGSLRRGGKKSNLFQTVMPRADLASPIRWMEEGREKGLGDTWVLEKSHENGVRPHP